MRFLPSALVLLLSASLGACQKNDPSPKADSTSAVEESSTAALIGRWELVATSGGFSGGLTTADPTHKQEIVFLPSGQTQLLLNGTITSTVRYSLATGPVITGGNGPFITLTPGADFNGSAIYRLTKTELVLSDNTYDGFSSHFIRR